MLTIRLLGELEVLHGGQPLPLPPSRKTRALLAYLVVTGRPQRRERLCELLWEVPDDPRGALRWSLSRLRSLLDEPGNATPCLVTDRETVGIDLRGIGVDLLGIRQDVAKGVESATTERLERAAAAFRGEFLADLDLPDCHAFQSWTVALRGDTRQLRAEILAALAGRFADTPDAALPHARELVGLNPLDEPAWAQLVRLLSAAGRRQEAEEQHETASRALREVGGPSGALLQAWREVRTASAATPQEVDSEPGSNDAASDRAPPPRPTAADPVPRQDIRFCVAEDGARIAYATVGQGPPLVRPANWMTHLDYDWQSPVWRHWLRELSRGRRLIRYDERGNGLSDWQVEDLSFDTCLRDLEAVIEAAGLERFPMLGISQGCAFAIAYAVAHPERVTRLVLYGGYVRGWAKRGSPSEIARRRALSALIKHGWGEDNPAFRQAFTTLFVPDATPEQISWFNELQRMTASPENAWRLHELFGQVDVRALLPRVRVPTLVLHGRQDGVVPFEEGRIIATEIPGARFVPLESRNHVLLESEPAWAHFLAEVRDFLASGEG